ncbi:MAG: hypothetical protein HQL17_02570 [Candidatus Omnitrophica bacterium]|nr:hypothetical protein [Candidatus Omnitrophota bacterium]
MAELQGIDYDALKKRGFLRQKQDEYFLFRCRMPCANFQSVHLEKVGEIARVHARGFVHVTTRQGIEIPFILYKDIDAVEKKVHEAGLEAGTSGRRLRTTTCCPGNNWCKLGLVDTFRLNARLEQEMGIRCGIDLPHKFKIALSGCPNACTRAQHSEIGIHGQVDISGGQKRIGYVVYLGGCGGRTPRTGLKLDKIFDEDGVLAVVDKVVRFYKEHVKAPKRLALVVEEIGRDAFLGSCGLL